MTFKELDISDELLESISYMGFKEATPIQEKAIPIIQSGKDLIGCAQTGTGKTAAFLLPILNKLCEERGKGINTVIIVPTRELAIQIDQQIQGLAYFAGIESLAVYGGGDGIGFDEQRKAMEKGADIIVATPGKFISHLNMEYIDLSHVQHFILDEADRMLDIGFHDDILKIIKFLPDKRQNLLFSATMPPKIRSFAKKILHDPAEISLSIGKPAEGVLQAAYMVYDNQKYELVRSLIADKPAYKSILIFCATKKKVTEVSRVLQKSGMNVSWISSDLDQKEREKTVNSFRSKNIRIVVATDVISRGIDIKDINLVINFDVPRDPEDYVHRVGRTARADTTGVALTFINEDDVASFQKIEALIEQSIIKLPLPNDMGEGPAYEISRRSSRGRGPSKFSKSRNRRN
jgi:superfamily II DNA/RNA helicase